MTLEARRSGGRVALIVADTGVGVPREDQTRIFEKFERGNPTRANRAPGLGLSLVKSFIELHGGTVELTSAPGIGTTVTCYLNAAAAPLIRARRSYFLDPSPPRSGGEGRVRGRFSCTGASEFLVQSPAQRGWRGAFGAAGMRRPTPAASGRRSLGDGGEAAFGDEAESQRCPKNAPSGASSQQKRSRS